MSANKYRISIKTPVDAPPGRVAYQLEAGRAKAGNDIYKILYSQKLPAVVDIEEISIPAPLSDIYSIYPPENELRIEITVTPVKHRHVTIEHVDDLYAKHQMRWMARLAAKIRGLAYRLRVSMRRR